MVAEDCTTGNRTAENRIRGLGREAVQCLLRADVGALAELLDESFVLRLPQSESFSREEWLRLLASGQVRYEALSVEHSEIHFYDRQIAFLTGFSNVKKVCRGRRVIGRFTYTALYVCKNGVWKMVALHQVECAAKSASAPA